MSTRRNESGGFASGILIAGIFGCSFGCTGQTWAQSATDRRQGPSGVISPADAELSLVASAILEAVSSRPSSMFSDDRSSPLLLAAASAIDALPASDASPSAAEEPPGEPFDERPLPYDPTSRASGSGTAGSGATGAGVSGAGQEASPASSGGMAGLGGLGWGLAPLRWGGSVGIQTSRNSSSGGSSSSNVQEFVNLRAASYIYQPWLAQVNGHLNLTKGQGGTSNGLSGAADGGTTRQGSGSVTGGAALNLLPSSRFPFSASFDVSDSRTTSELLENHYTNTRYAMRQSYRPEGGNYSVQGGYDHSTLTFTDSARQSRDSVNAVSGGFSRNAGPQRIQADANISRSTNDSSGAGARLMQLNSQHTYQLEENLSYNSTASITDSTFSALGEKGLVENHGRFMQFNSYMNWQPEAGEDDEEQYLPLFVTAGVRTLSAMNEFSDSSTSSRSVGANVSANYTYSPNLSIQGNALLTQVANSGAKSQLLSVLGGGANYSGDPLTFGKVSYNWGFGGSASRQTITGATSDAASSNLTLSGQANHGLSTAFRMSDVSTIYLTGTQSLSEISDSLSGNATTLTHTAGANYSGVTGENMQAGVGINYSDTLTKGRAEGHYRFLNLLINGQMQFNTHSSGSANLNFQWSGSENPATPIPSATGLLESGVTKQSRLNIFGSLNYQNQRAFGVRALRYNADFTANTLMENERLFGNASAAPVGATYTLSNRLTYRIGLLDFELKALLNATAGRKNALIFFRAYRDFGGF